MSTHRKQNTQAAAKPKPLLTRHEAIDLAAGVMFDRSLEQWQDQTKIRITPLIDALIALGVLEVKP